MLKLKIISIVLIVSLITTFLPAGGVVYASESDYTYTISGGVATITGYTGPGGDVVIPSSLGGYPVKIIGELAFSFETGITSIVLPEGITIIGEFAFNGCYNLSSINLPEGLVNLGRNAFDMCGSLKSIIIPESLKRIEIATFRGCSSLEDINITNNITSIGANAFASCSSLTSINIPDSINYIDSGTFQYCSSLTSVTIGNSVMSINSDAFRGCSSLTNIDIPASVINILGSPFRECSSLLSINVNEENQYYSSENGILYDKQKYLLIKCPEAKSDLISIPPSTTRIGFTAFANCYNITSIIIPDSVSNIDASTFEYCSNLQDIIFMGSPPVLGSNVFGGVPTSNKIYYISGTTDWGSTFGGRPTQEFDPMDRYTVTYHDIGSTQGIPPIDNNQYFVNAIVTIKENTGELQRDYADFIGWSFYENTNKVNLFPNDKLQIGVRDIDLYPVWNNIFEYRVHNSNVTITGYNRLEEHIQIPETIMGMDVIGISKDAFKEKGFIKSIHIPKTVINISEGTFYNLSALE